ncbi:hypothetical protein V8G54_029508 [Vigna mungo]|uniref:Uncharacterized protein n=1 Tax=Vigna mungo TaxID=3915 RepID=A0AAQ3MUE2_VIGMU
MCYAPSSPASNGGNNQMRLNTHQISLSQQPTTIFLSKKKPNHPELICRSEIFHRQLPPLALHSKGDALAGEVEAALVAVAYDEVMVAPDDDRAGSARSKIEA